jgi:aspartyl/glutamyl-tRNA(Asn/Gln) amidotransferase C subunit
MDRQELIVTARLALLEVSETEIKRLEAEVDQMLSYFSQMRDLELKDSPDAGRAVPENRLRADAVRPLLQPAARSAPQAAGNSADLLENAPEREERFISIPNVL